MKHFYLIILVIAFCSVHAVGQASEAGRLVYGEAGRLDGFDPYTIHEAAGQRLSDLLFDSLLEVGPGGEYVASLAKSWQVDKAGTGVIFTLRDGVKWHARKAGEENAEAFFLTPEDVVTTVRILSASASEIPNRERFQVIRSAEKLDDHRVAVYLKRAMVDPLRPMMFKILPTHELGSAPSLRRDSTFVKHPIGTGPYFFVEANQQGEVLLAANKNYFRGVPHIERIIMKSFADQTVMAQSLMYGSLDLITYVGPRDLGEILGDARLGVVPYDALSFAFFALNTERAPLKDKRVRQAIALALNRQEMLEAFFQGKGRIVSGPFPPTSWAYNLDVKPLPFDQARSKALLSLAGLVDKNSDGFLESANGKPVTLVFAVPLAGESEMIKRVVLAFQSYLEKVGIRVELQFMDWLVWKKKVLGEHDYDVTIASWSFDDASNIMSLFHSSSAKPWGNNFVMYHNYEVDALLTEADVTNDFDKRRAIYHKLHAILADEAPYTFLWTLVHHAAHTNDLMGVRVEPFAFFKYVTSWDIKPAKGKSGAGKNAKVKEGETP
jgi:peptide/nickel transport system substrate-binding protein